MDIYIDNQPVYEDVSNHNKISLQNMQRFFQIKLLLQSEKLLHQSHMKLCYVITTITQHCC